MSEHNPEMYGGYVQKDDGKWVIPFNGGKKLGPETIMEFFSNKENCDTCKNRVDKQNPNWWK